MASGALAAPSTAQHGPDGLAIVGLTGPKRGVREQVLYKRAGELRRLADQLIYALTSKLATSDYALSTEEQKDWEALQAFILRILPDCRSPYLLHDDHIAVIVGRLTGGDAAYAEYAASLANLVVFARVLLASRDAAQPGAAVSSQLAADLVAAAHGLARFDAPFHLYTERDIVVDLLLGLRTHAILIAPEQERPAYVDVLFGDGSSCPQMCQGMWRTSAQLRRTELVGRSRDQLQLTYPFDRILEHGLDYVRSILRLLVDPTAELPAAPAIVSLPPAAPMIPATPPLPPHPSQQPPHSVDHQLAALLNGEGPSTPTSIDPRNNMPIFSTEAYRGLIGLEPGVIENFLSNLERATSPGGTERFRIMGQDGEVIDGHGDIPIDPDLGCGGFGSGSGGLDAVDGVRLRFGPTGTELSLEPRAFNLGRSSLFDPQPDAERIVFDSQHQSSAAKGKRRAPASKVDANGRKKKKQGGVSKDELGGEEADGEISGGSSSVSPKPMGKRELGQLNRNPWTKEEEELLKAELALCYDQVGCWSTIIKRHGPKGEFSTILASRNNVGLKDKARNMRMTYERRKQEVPIFLSAVSGIRSREVTMRRKTVEVRSTRPMAPAELLRRQREEAERQYEDDDDTAALGTLDFTNPIHF